MGSVLRMKAGLLNEPFNQIPDELIEYPFSAGINPAFTLRVKQYIGNRGYVYFDLLGQAVLKLITTDVAMNVAKGDSLAKINYLRNKIDNNFYVCLLSKYKLCSESLAKTQKDIDKHCPYILQSLVGVVYYYLGGYLGIGNVKDVILNEWLDPHFNFTQAVTDIYYGNKPSCRGPSIPLRDPKGMLKDMAWVPRREIPDSTHYPFFNQEAIIPVPPLDRFEYEQRISPNITNEVITSLGNGNVNPLPIQSEILPSTGSEISLPSNGNVVSSRDTSTFNRIGGLSNSLIDASIRTVPTRFTADELLEITPQYYSYNMIPDIQSLELPYTVNPNDTQTSPQNSYSNSELERIIFGV